MKIRSTLSILVALAVTAACSGSTKNGTTGTGSGSTTGTTSGGSSGFSNPASGSYLEPGGPSGTYAGAIVFETNTGLEVGNVYFQVNGVIDFASPPDPSVTDAGGTILSGIELQVATPSNANSLIGSYSSTGVDSCGGITVTTPVTEACGLINILSATSACPLGTDAGPPAQGSWTLDITSVSDPMTSNVGFMETLYLAHGTFTANLACGATGDSCFTDYCVPTATLTATF